MAVIIDDNNNSGIEVNLPDTFDGNNDNGNDRDAEAASTSYEEDNNFSISSAGGGGGGSWRFLDSINRMTIAMVLCLFILLGLTAGLSAITAAKNDVVANMSSPTISSSPTTTPPPTTAELTVDEEPTIHPTGTPSPSVLATPDRRSAYTIGVYYYPWHGSNFHNGRYLRGDLQPPQLPALGEYDDTDPAVIAQHLQWSRGANINLWVTSWWGPKSREDSTVLNVIFPHEDLAGTRIALFYETTSRIKMSANYSTENVYSDVAYIAKTYFDDPNYMRIDGRPVLFVYLTRVLSRVGKLENATALMRQAAMENGGHNLYIMGDQVFNDAPDNGNTYEPFDLLDGVTNYDIYGNLGRPDGYAGIERLTDLTNRNKKWRNQTRAHGDCAFVPGVAPGYNDRSVRDGHTALSRKLDEDKPEGSLFRVSLEMALDLTEESTGKMLMITSWNEWHEDTQIEPVVGTGQQTDNPWNLTCYGETCDKALTYDAYGMLYLDILRNVTSRVVD